MPSKKRPKDKSILPNEVELSKRGAAGLAKTTQGRARIIPDKTVYDRKTIKREDDNNERQDSD